MFVSCINFPSLSLYLPRPLSCFPLRLVIYCLPFTFLTLNFHPSFFHSLISSSSVISIFPLPLWETCRRAVHHVIPVHLSFPLVSPFINHPSSMTIDPPREMRERAMPGQGAWRRAMSGGCTRVSRGFLRHGYPISHETKWRWGRSSRAFPPLMGLLLTVSH